MNRPSLSSLVPLGLVAALAACASSASEQKPAAETPAAAAPGPTTTTTAVVKQSPDLNDRKTRLAQTLLEVDQRVDRYVQLGSQPGEDARGERRLLESAIGAQVGQHRDEFLSLASAGGDPQSRRTAVKALGFIDDPAVIPVLISALSVKDDPRLVTNATYSLSRLKNPTIPVDPLLALVRDPDPGIRSNALMTLWHTFEARRTVGASPLDPIQTQQVLPILEGALFDPADALVRANAAAALGALGDPRALDPLLNLLRDSHPLVRTQTALALGKLGDLKAVPALVKTIDVTPAGTPRTVVTLALTMIMEKHGYKPPNTLGDSGRVWETWVREAMAARPPK